MSANDNHEGWITICKNSHIVETEILDDHISNLPDDIIGHILSRLPTKDALQTSVLSRAWEYKWTSIYDFHIDYNSKCGSGLYECLFPGSRVQRFVNCVTRILVRTCNSRIRRFCLSFVVLHDSIDIKNWLSCVLKRNVEILKINAPYLSSQLHRCFFNWASLSELELDLISCTFVLPASNSFTNLKKLRLQSGSFIKIKAEQISSEGRIILNFPVLEVLVLKRCDWLDVNFVEIHAPELITFETMCLCDLRNYEIRIFGPKLASFKSLCGSINNFYLCTPVVSSAELTGQVYGETLRRMQRIVNQIPGLTRLKVSHHVVYVLLRSKPRFVLPTFDRLTELHLCDRGCMKDLLEVLQLLPPLELLCVNVEAWDNVYGTKTPLPPNIVSNLKRVELENFSGKIQELDFSEFVLKNARNLMQMSIIIGNRSKMTPEKANHLLSNLKPKSSSCIFVCV